MIHPRSISTKLLLAITVAVVLPFLGFYAFVRWEMGDRLSRDVVVYFLKSKASDLADKINQLLEERGKDLRIWQEDPMAVTLLQRPENEVVTHDLQKILNRYCQEKQVYDLLLVADKSGKIVATNTVNRDGTFLAPSWLEYIRSKNISAFPWFQEAASGNPARVNWHRSPLLFPEPEKLTQNPADYGVGFAGPILDPETKEFLGVWYNLMNWRYIQVDILDQAKNYFQTLQTPESYKSGYAWLWKSDADSIIGHKNRSLYGRRVTGEEVDLPQLTESALKERWGVFPEYEFPPGTKKNAAFRWTKTESEGGFGWIVGIGIDNDDIFSTIEELGQIFLLAMFLILGGLGVWIWIVSRTISQPVKNLIASTAEIAKGNLEARVQVETRDEIGTLAQSFNKMTEDLEVSRAKLIRAEKEAAWREMARQIAHEIKNPLTPIQLSTDLMRKAYLDKSPKFPEILERSTNTILRQIASLRKIASDFSAFAGRPKREPAPIPILSVLRDCVSLYEGWAEEKKIRIEVAGEDGLVLADPDEIRRVFINLIDNAFEAVGSDGRISIAIEKREKNLEIRVEDTGSGIHETIQDKLFEPYFSTKTTGTGLGLAICHRVVHDLGGQITVESASGMGTVFRVVLPLHGAPAS